MKYIRWLLIIILAMILGGFTAHIAVGGKGDMASSMLAAMLWPVVTGIFIYLAIFMKKRKNKIVR